MYYLLPSQVVHYYLRLVRLEWRAYCGGCSPRDGIVRMIIRMVSNVVSFKIMMTVNESCKRQIIIGLILCLEFCRRRKKVERAGETAIISTALLNNF